MKNILVRRQLSLIKKYIKYLYASMRLGSKQIDAKIMTNVQTLEYILEHRCSVIRFGDGELMYIDKNGFPFQRYDDNLANQLKNCLTEKRNNLLVCLPEPIFTCDNLKKESKWHWTYVVFKNWHSYSALVTKNELYGNAFISRPYMVYKDKQDSKKCFELLKKIWEKRNVILVEGQFSRSGVGNDLFEQAKSIERILAPAANAYDYYEEILEAILSIHKNNDTVVLVALGPTAKPLVRDLAQKGIWAIDIGHIDSEYEWFQQGAVERVAVEGKHTAEFMDENIAECFDDKYVKSIVCRIGVRENE